MSVTVRIVRAPSYVRLVRQGGASGKSALAVAIEQGAVAEGTTEAEFATWLSSSNAAAAASALAADGSADAAAADALATAADRVQTGLDRIQTGAEALATAADRVQTGLDRAATGQDRTATGVDLSAASAQRVLSETARAGSEAARDAAQAYATAAADAVSAALGIPLALSPVVVSTGGYVLTAADHGKMLAFNGSGRVLVYVDAGLPADFTAGLLKVGTGDVEVRQGLGVVDLQAPGALLTITTRYAYAVLRRIDASLHVVHTAQATLPALGINRALLNQSAAGAIAVLMLS